MCVCLCLCLHDLYIIMSVCLLLLSRFKAPRTKVSRGLRLQYAHPGVGITLAGQRLLATMAEKVNAESSFSQDASGKDCLPFWSFCCFPTV